MDSIGRRSAVREDACSRLLGDVERQSEVAASIFRIEFGEVERFRVEVMNQRTERHAVGPARRKVGDVHVLPTVHEVK